MVDILVFLDNYFLLCLVSDYPMVVATVEQVNYFVSHHIKAIHWLTVLSFEHGLQQPAYTVQKCFHLSAM